MSTPSRAPSAPAPALRRAVVLASASPRRRELLAAAGLAFTIEVSAVDEELDARTPPEEAALELAERKARAVASRMLERAAQETRSVPDLLVLAADTIVAVGEGAAARLLGKAADEREASAMLGALSLTRHRVITGVCALRTSDLALCRGFERTFVTMRAIDPREIADYVASGEWKDKAGAYAIQESADRFVTKLEEGGFDNVVGLPVALSLRLLAELDAR